MFTFKKKKNKKIKNNSFYMIYKLLYPCGTQFRSPQWQESPWVCMHSGWSPHRDRKTCTHTHTHTHRPVEYSFTI